MCSAYPKTFLLFFFSSHVKFPGSGHRRSWRMKVAPQKASPAAASSHQMQTQKLPQSIKQFGSTCLSNKVTNGGIRFIFREPRPCEVYICTVNFSLRAHAPNLRWSGSAGQPEEATLANHALSRLRTS